MSDEHKHDGCDNCGGSQDKEPPKDARVLNTDAKASNQTTLRVDGMDCPDEIAAIERVLKPLAGVREVKVSLMAGTATIVHEQSVTPEQLIQAIGTAGLKASAVTNGNGPEDEHRGGSGRVRLVSVIISGVFTGVSLLLHWQNLFAP